MPQRNRCLAGEAIAAYNARRGRSPTAPPSAPRRAPSTLESLPPARESGQDHLIPGPTPSTKRAASLERVSLTFEDRRLGGPSDGPKDPMVPPRLDGVVSDREGCTARLHGSLLGQGHRSLHLIITSPGISSHVCHAQHPGGHRLMLCDSTGGLSARMCCAQSPQTMERRTKPNEHHYCVPGAGAASASRSTTASSDALGCPSWRTEPNVKFASLDQVRRDERCYWRW